MRRLLLALGIALAVGAPPARAQTPAPDTAVAPPVLAAKAAILADVRTGKVLFSKEPHVRLAPASLTKVLTALVANERYQLDEMVTVTDAVNTVRGEKLGLKPGMQLTVRDLLYAMLLLSGNDAATALAAHHPLGLPQFITDMNVKARSLGAFDSSFSNPHGLDEPGHLSSAWDMALLSRRLLTDETLAAIVASKTYTIPWPDGTQRVIQNHNKLLWRYDGTIGVKTGFTNLAGKCLIAAVEVPAGTAVTVVLHSPDHYAETTSLFDYYKSDPPIPPTAPALGTPKPSPRVVAAGGPASVVPDVDEAAGLPRWVLFPMSLLAMCMLLTLRLPGSRGRIREAAQFHPYLEPLAEEQ